GDLFDALAHDLDIGPDVGRWRPGGELFCGSAFVRVVGLGRKRRENGARVERQRNAELFKYRLVFSDLARRHPEVAAAFDRDLRAALEPGRDGENVGLDFLDGVNVRERGRGPFHVADRRELLVALRLPSAALDRGVQPGVPDGAAEIGDKLALPANDVTL